MTPETLVRHELAGLDVEVVDSSNPDAVGIAGRVRDETMRTLLVATGEGVKQVPKATATFRFDPVVGDTAGRGSAPGDAESVRVEVDGERLLARPARRTEQTGGSQWQ
jgi:ribonuclease P protein subunit POP4